MDGADDPDGGSPIGRHDNSFTRSSFRQRRGERTAGASPSKVPSTGACDHVGWRLERPFGRGSGEPEGRWIRRPNLRPPATNRCARFALRGTIVSARCLEVGARLKFSVCTGLLRRLRAQTLAEGPVVCGHGIGARRRVHCPGSSRQPGRDAAGGRRDSVRPDGRPPRCSCAISLGPRQIFCRVWDRWRAIRLCRTHETEVVVEETGRVLVFSVPEAARLLGISRTHAYGLVARGELVHVRLGRRIVVPRHAIDALLQTPPDGPAAA